MQPAEPSATSMFCARARALHLRLDDRPWIYEDRLAAEIIDLDGQIAGGLNIQAAHTPIAKRLRGTFLARERFCEDRLAEAVAAGATQYVVLGAGMNSFALQGSDLAKRVTVFEIDHPDTQLWKRRRLATLGIEIPDRVRFVPADFARDSLGDCLRQHGFRDGERTVFAMNGVTQYIDDKALVDTFTKVAQIGAPGSSLLVQLILHRELTPERDREELDFVTRVSAEEGEPWIASQDPREVESCLLAAGYRAVEHASAEVMMQTYFQGRRDGLELSGYVSMLAAAL